MTPTENATADLVISPPTWLTSPLSPHMLRHADRYVIVLAVTAGGSRVQDMTTEDRLVWVDCEMTGLSLDDDALIEVACVVTDAQLVELDDGIDVIIKPDQPALDQMNDFVRNMHTESGLLNELSDGVTLAEAERQVSEYVLGHCTDPKKAPLCGSSVYVDRGFLARDMPTFDALLHYRVIDVSTIKELARRWYKRAYFASPEKVGGHRALADIRESIAELRYYRETVFVPDPGPSTEQAREAAGRHGPTN